jgi:uncharacterized RDD family membrane protein YckC
VVDAALITVVAVLVGVSIALALAVLRVHGRLDSVVAAICGAAYVAWTFGYFVWFWSLAGQTPGARAMRIRVVAPTGDPPAPARALTRCFGIIVSALPLFLGFAPILVDPRRRGLHDWLAGTLVVEAPELSAGQLRRARQRAAFDARRGSAIAGDSG